MNPLQALAPHQRNRSATLLLFAFIVSLVFGEHEGTGMTASHSEAVALFHSAYKCIENKKPEEAVTLLRRAVIISPRFTAAYSNLGTMLQRLDFFDEALVMHTRAIQLAPTCHECYNNRGLVHLRNNHAMTAAKDYEMTIQLAPTFADAYGNMGTVVGGQSLHNNVADAMYWYRTATSLAPNSVRHYNNLAGALLATRHPVDALKIFKLQQQVLGASVDVKIAALTWERAQWNASTLAQKRRCENRLNACY